MKRAKAEGLFQKGPILDFLSKNFNSISTLSSGDFTPFNGMLTNPCFRIEEILRLILHKSRTFATVGIIGQNQSEDNSRIHPLDIIMFVLG